MVGRWSSRRSRRIARHRDVTLIVHEYDKSAYTSWISECASGPTPMVVDVLRELQARRAIGRLHVASPADQPQSQVAILHVDSTVVPIEYREFARSFDRCLNSRVVDISKRGLDVTPVDQGWTGPVIVKSQLNYRGRPETRHNARARAAGMPEPFPGATAVADYEVFDQYSDVPLELREDERLVVQRFVPERDADGYAIRHWIFAGDAGYCKRFVSSEPMVKADNVRWSEPVPVPAAMHRERSARGFDFGKFDFVVHGDEVVLFDANKTPGAFPTSTGDTADRVRSLADGLGDLLNQPDA